MGRDIIFSSFPFSFSILPSSRLFYLWLLFLSLLFPPSFPTLFTLPPPPTSSLFFLPPRREDDRLALFFAASLLEREPPAAGQSPRPALYFPSLPKKEGQSNGRGGGGVVSVEVGPFFPASKKKESFLSPSSRKQAFMRSNEVAFFLLGVAPAIGSKTNLV